VLKPVGILLNRKTEIPNIFISAYSVNGDILSSYLFDTQEGRDNFAYNLFMVTHGKVFFADLLVYQVDGIMSLDILIGSGDEDTSVEWMSIYYDGLIERS
jgi:hypothetical protein